MGSRRAFAALGTAGVEIRQENLAAAGGRGNTRLKRFVLVFVALSVSLGSPARAGDQTKI